MIDIQEMLTAFFFIVLILGLAGFLGLGIYAIYKAINREYRG